MIAKAMIMEEGPIKDGFIGIIAAYMKLAYKNWNKDHYVSDENIATDIKMMSGGKLALDKEADLDILGGGGRGPVNTHNPTVRKRRRHPSNGKRNRRRKTSRH